MSNKADRFIKKGFKPISRRGDSIILKSNSGIVITNDDGTAEGFLKSSSINESVMNEGKIMTGVFTMILVANIITYFTTDITIIDGISMSPTYESGNILIRSRSARKVDGMINRNSVVRFISPKGDQCIKRIVGVPGDKVEFRQAEILINGKVVDDYNLKAANDYLFNHRHDPNYKYPEFELKDGQYFVLGDNRTASVDSRDFGPIDKSHILAVVDK